LGKKPSSHIPAGNPRVAIQTATRLGLNSRTFAMMVTMVVSFSCLTPLEPACLMVYGIGKQRFSDVFQVGRGGLAGTYSRSSD
jgi:di/tricarboxylate transporter